MRSMRGEGMIGTTGRGIGPAYEDKVARVGIRFVDLLEEDTFREKLERNIEEKNFYLKAILKEKALDFNRIHDSYGKFREKLKGYVSNTGLLLDQKIRAGASCEPRVCPKPRSTSTFAIRWPGI